MKLLSLITCTWLLAFMHLNLAGQTIDASIPEACNTGKNTPYLSDEEKQVLMYLNIARAHPKEFLAYYLPGAAKTLNEDKVPEYKSLVKELKSMKSVSMLDPDEGLTRVAKEHAEDMGTNGKMGHKSSKGKSYEERLKAYKGKAIAENCDYGYSDPVLIVTHLLIDSKEGSLGHRKNILNAAYNSAGISIQPHKIYKFNCVMDFLE